MRKVLLALSLLLCSTVSIAQNFWSANNNVAAIKKDKDFDGSGNATNYKLHKHNRGAIRNDLFKVVNGPAKHNTITAIHNVSGKMEAFEMKEPSSFEPVVKDKYYGIGSFSGSGAGILGLASISGSIDPPKGITCTASGENTEYIKWDAVGGVSVYSVEYKLSTSSVWIFAATRISATFTNITGLSSFTQYDVRITAHNCPDNSTAQASFKTPKCFPPANLASTVKASTEHIVTWTFIPGQTSYTVRYKKSSEAIWKTISTPASNTTASLKITGLTANTLYDWQIKTNCVAITTDDDFSSKQQFTTGCGATVPLGILTTSVTATSATVNWDKTADAVSYKLEYKMNTDDSWTEKTVQKTTASKYIYPFTNLIPGKTYAWRLKANCSSGSGAYATTSTFNTLCNLAAPSGLMSYLITPATATLSWKAVDGAISYTVEYKLRSATTWSKLIPVEGLFTEVTGLTSSTIYDWRVTANCNAGSGTPSLSGFFTTACNLPAVEELTTDNVTSSTATIKWKGVTGAASYAVEYKPASGLNWISRDKAVTGTSIPLTGLTPGTFYEYRVWTNCTKGETVYAEESFYTVCNGPVVSGFKYDASSTSAFIIWNAVSGVDEYSVRYKASGSTKWLIASSNTGNDEDTTRRIFDLAPGTVYDWEVSAHCINGYSDYVGGKFNTRCNTPGSLRSQAYSDLAYLDWIGTEGSKYDIDFKLHTATTWTSLATNISEASYAKDVLAANTVYDWRVRATCTTGKSDYVQATFTTAATTFSCNSLLTGLRVTDISTTSATVRWIPLNWGPAYIVDHKLSSSSEWKSNSTAKPFYVFNDLEAGKVYDWRITPFCRGGVYSTSQFATMASDCSNAYEPDNNTSSSGAIPLAPGLIYKAAIEKEGDVDWFKITTTTTTNNRFTLTGAEGKSFTVSIYKDPNDSPVDIANSTSGTSILRNAEPAGTYYIKVTGQSQSGCYAINVTTKATSACVTTGEPANNKPTGAIPLTSGTSVQGAIDEADDVDWFRIALPAGNCAFRLDAPAGVRYQFAIFKMSENDTLRFESFQTFENITNTLYGLEEGNYFIKISGSDNMISPLCYTLAVTATSICKSEIEPNNIKESSIPLMYSEFISATLTNNDADWYKITTATTTNNQYALEGPVGVNFNLYIYNSSGTIVKSGTGSTATEKVTVTNQLPGTYYIKVVGLNGATDQGCYTLSVIDILHPCTAAFEPNESLSNATLILEPGISGKIYSAAISSANDIDFYKITTSLYASIKFSLSKPTGVNYKIEAYKKDGTKIASSTGSDILETIILYNQPADEYYIKVYGINGSSSLECYGITADWYNACGTSETNEIKDNEKAGAKEVKSGSYYNAAITSSTDVDWYKIITTSTTTNTFILIVPQLLNYDVYIYDSAGVQIGSGTDVGYDYVKLVNQSAGTYYIKVVGVNGASGPDCYTLSATATKTTTALRSATPVTATTMQQPAAPAINIDKQRPSTPVIKTPDQQPAATSILGAEVTAFPNPFTNKVQLYIPGIKGSAQINVLDMYGKSVLQATTAATNTQLDMSRFASGMYIIKVMNDGKESILKVAKQ